MRPLPALLALSLLLVACGQAPDKDSPPPVAPGGGAKTHVPTQAQMQAILAEGPDPTLRKMAVADYWLHYKLMQGSGIERALGGEAQAIAALQALGNAYERKLRGTEADMPKLVPAAFTGEGMASGYIGLSMAGFAGMMMSGVAGSALSGMSDERLAELAAKGPLKFDGKSGSAEIQVGKDGSISQSVEYEVNESGLNGKVAIKTQMTACPDQEGRVEIAMEVDSRMSVSSKPGTGGSIHSSFKYERFLDDDARLMQGDDGAAIKVRTKMTGSENFESQGVDITFGRTRGGEQIFENHGEQGMSIFRPDEVENTRRLLEASAGLQALLAEIMLRGIGNPNGAPWESGRCVKLDVTSSPSKRRGIRPNTAFDLEARPRATADGRPAGGTVTAVLSGGASLQPASGKVAADARYGYAGPDKKNEEASIAFEARSKRGVGRATLEFDTRAVRAYAAEGGLDEFHGTGTICDLGQPFTISGSGNTVTFTPSSERGGSYSYQGNMSGIGVSGSGTFTATADEHGGTITGTGNGCVQTPMGTRCSDGTEQYTLTPIDPCQ